MSLTGIHPPGPSGLVGRMIGAVSILFLTVPLLARALPQDGRPYELDPERGITHLMHNSWQEGDGLPQNTVDAIVQDDRGYLWLGTQVGLVRFDGVSFRVYDRARVEALLSNQIKALFKDSDGVIWIGTDEGGITRMENGEFETFTTEDGLSSNTVRSFYEDEEGNLWIGTRRGGLVRYDGSSFTTFTGAEGLVGNVVLSIGEARDGTMLVGTDAGLRRLRDGQIEPVPNAGPLSDLPITRIVAARSDSSLWLGTAGGGVFSWTDGIQSNMTEEDGLSGSNVVALHEDQSGALWIGLKTSGLNRYYRGEISTYGETNGLTHNHVTAIYQDRERTLWVGTDLGGLNQLRDGKFTTYTTADGLSSRIVYSVIEDREGTVWIGTEGGVDRLVGDTIVGGLDQTAGLPSNVVYSLAIAPKGGVWIGMFAGGVCRYRNGELFCLDETDGLGDGNVFATYVDSQDRLWVGTGEGLALVQNDEVARVYREEDGLVSNWVNYIREDTEGGLWIGTFGGGISRFEDGSFTNYTDVDGLSSNVVLTLHESPDGTLWAGTQRGGLCRFRNERFRCLSSDDGLFADDILQIVEDEEGYLWLGGLNGIARVSIDRLHRRLEEVRIADEDSVAAGSLESAVYGKDDGLVSSETNGGIQPAAWRTRDGRLLFSTIDGLAATDPSRIHKNTVPPSVVLERVFVDDRDISGAGQLELQPGSQRFEFHYTGISFIAPEEITFRYRLEGYDDEWIEADTRREAYYTNLSPGRYEFQVAAINNDGVASTEAATLSFYVRPFFYQTVWFYLLCAGGLILLGAGVYHLRTRQLRRREDMLNRLVEEQTQELRERERELETLNDELEEEVEKQLDVILAERRRYERELIKAKEKAEESARLKTNILMNMSHEIRTPLATILGFAEELKESVDTDEEKRFVAFIQRSSKRLLDTLSSVLEMSKLRSGSKDVSPEEIDVVREVGEAVELLQPRAREKNLDLSFSPSEDSMTGTLDPSALHRIVNNLVGNAIKFTDEGRIDVRMSRRDGRVELVIEDTGSGIDEEFQKEMFEAFKQGSSGAKRTHEGTGLGLTITSQLVDLMDGEIDVESDPGRGSCFLVRLPLIHEEEPVSTDA